jgi:hypothetical protein
MGESDIKWTRYTAWGNILLDAIDSDYVVIGCATIERLGLAAPKVFVRRLLLSPGNAAVSAVAEAAAGKPITARKGNKRTVTGGSVDTVSAGGANPKVDAKPLGRQYEFVDCGLVVEGLRATIGMLTPDAMKPYTVRLLTHSISLCGCDFTKGVPWLNGTAAQRNMKLLWPGLCKAASINPETDSVVLDPRIVAEEYIGLLWKKVQFKKQCAGLQSVGFENLYQALKNDETISTFRRDRLISPEEMSCLVRNGNWVASYWSVPEKTPCALKGDFGFFRHGNGKVQFDLSTPLPTATAITAVNRVAPHAWLSPDGN